MVRSSSRVAIPVGKTEGKTIGMKRLAKAALLAAIAFMGLTGRDARGAAFPSVINLYVPFSQFQGERSVTGPDGNNRFIWDYYATSVHQRLRTLEGSVVWILDPTGNLVAASPAIPPVGNGISSTTFSNIALHVSADNNTTLAFAYWDPTHTYIGSLGTWTLNAKGALIGASGPVGFGGLQITNIEFNQDYLVVTFAPAGQSFSRRYHGWAILGLGVGRIWPFDLGRRESNSGPRFIRIRNPVRSKRVTQSIVALGGFSIPASTVSVSR